MRYLQTVCLIFLLLIGHACISQPQQLKVSANGRFLITKDGRPFFWLGDTGWELFHQLDRSRAEKYFKTRSSQGFNVIQAVVLAELDGLHRPNANGDLPLFDDNPLKCNEAYFRYVDTIIDLASKYNLYIALLPTWGDKLYKNAWGKGPEIFNKTNAYQYGKWIGTRYRTRSNIIWVIGGDRSPRDGSQDAEVWREMARGIGEGTGGQDHALMTFHPQPDGTSSSSQWFENDSWLDINMLQTGHCRDTPVWELVNADYVKKPVRPVINGENIYEEMPVCFNPKDLGYASPYDVRKSAYLSVFAGACGHTYGCGPVIWFSEKKDNLFAALHTWEESLDLPGANEMKFLRVLMESRPMLDRIPDQDMLAGDGSCAAERIQATRGEGYAFIYSAYGRMITVRTEHLWGDSLVAHWFDPRTGQTRYAGTFARKAQLSFTPPLPVAAPVPSARQDWVLVLDDASKRFAMPVIHE